MVLPVSPPLLAEPCEHRHPAAPPDDGCAECGLLLRLAGGAISLDARVGPDACRACSQASAALPGRVNPVVASLLFAATSRRAADPSISRREEAEVGQLREYAAIHLAAAEAARTPATAPCPASAPTDWRFLRQPRLGLLGANTPTGLGAVNRDLAAHLAVRRWILPRHAGWDSSPPPRRWGRRDVRVELDASQRELSVALRGLDWLLFVESPVMAPFVPLAKSLGVRVACVCNWEWTCPTAADWLYDVDLMICPARHTWKLMHDWRQRFGFGWRICYVPWPIDTRRFRFRQRRRCERFLFINGTGGARGRRRDGTLTPFRRKGIELLFETARRAPRIPFLVYSQSWDLPAVPRNVELRPSPTDNRALYTDGDVCVQPSHWEGLGLQLLECQAAGMPLVTTDAAPMNEHQPAETIPVVGEDIVFLRGHQPVAAQLMSPERLAEILQRWSGRDVSAASMAARRYVVRHRDWTQAAAVLHRALREAPDRPF